MDKLHNTIQLHILISVYIKDTICDRGSGEYKKIIEFVSDVDELLEQRQFENLGESEEEMSDSDYKGISLTLNVSNDTPDCHLSGRIDFLLMGGRRSMHLNDPAKMVYRSTINRRR